MSWVQAANNEFVITTGDGQRYRFDWMNPTKTKEFNITEFDFPNQRGTLVSRTTSRGRRFEVTIFIVGENHLDQAEAFDESSEDPRPWTLEHPFYGIITVQPLQLNFDNSAFNVTKITGTLVETITEDNPRASIDPRDKIRSDKQVFNDITVETFVINVKPQVREINFMRQTNTAIFNEGKKGIKLDIDSEEYFNRFNKANAAILNATAEPLETIRTIQAVVDYPALFTEGVAARLIVLGNQFNLLRSSIANINTPSLKRIYEAFAGGIISSMAVCVSTPQEGDYQSRPDVVSAVDTIAENYETYHADLDSFQTLTGGGTDSYIPNVDSNMALDDLVNFTIASLFDIALEAKQERSIILESDSNVILLAHRFYGLKQDDSTIDQFIRQNQIGLNEMLVIGKNRKIVYYV